MALQRNTSLQKVGQAGFWAAMIGVTVRYYDSLIRRQGVGVPNLERLFNLDLDDLNLLKTKLGSLTEKPRVSDG
jgi:hypothetical protein